MFQTVLVKEITSIILLDFCFVSGPHLDAVLSESSFLGAHESLLAVHIGTKELKNSTQALAGKAVFSLLNYFSDLKIPVLKESFSVTSILLLTPKNIPMIEVSMSPAEV